MTKTQWYIGAPNGVILCIDSVRERQLTSPISSPY